jgi:hypothetical protein
MRDGGQVTKSMARMCAAAGQLVRVSSVVGACEECAAMTERTAALALDLLALVADTGAGWRLLAPQFGALVSTSPLSGSGRVSVFSGRRADECRHRTGRERTGSYTL